MIACYHVYQVNDWRELVAEQLGLMRGAGLLDALEHLYVGVDGAEKVDVDGLPVSATVHHRPGESEAGTLRALRDWARVNDGYALYLHTKGVTRPGSPEARDWRRLMEYFCVERWRDCAALLRTHGAVGVNLLADCHLGSYPHFSGNVWWATAAHLRTLDDDLLDRPERLYREFWIGSGAPLHGVHHSAVDHYVERYPAQVYRGSR